MRKYILSFLILFSIGSQVRINATAQDGDLLIIGNDTLMVFTCPIEYNKTLSDSIQGRKDRNCLSTGCWRGYIGIWRLEANKLYLEKIRNSSMYEPYTYINTNGIFDNYKDEQGRILASWFTGELRIIQGKCTNYVHMGFESNYEHETMYQVKDGIVVDKREYHNHARKAKLNWYQISTILTENFNGDLFPELANSKLIAQIKVLPDINGKIDSLDISIKVGTNEPTKYPNNHPYMQEVLRCLRLIPDWEVNYIYEKIKWQYCSLPLWRGKGCKIQLYSGQLPDSIYYNDSIFALRQLPLQYDTQLYARIRPYLNHRFNEDCRRGYTAIWELKNNRLYIKSIYLLGDSTAFPLKKLFPKVKADKPVKVSWYNGYLQLFYGERLTKKNDYYPIEIDLNLERGVINRSKRYSNYAIPRDGKAYEKSEQMIKSLNWSVYNESYWMTHIDYTIFPDLNGKAQDIQVELYDAEKISDQEIITVLKRACHDALSQVRWEVIYEREKIIPIKGSIYINLNKENQN